MMAVVFTHKRSIWVMLAAILSLFVYNEFLVYYIVLLQCQWPQLDADKADPHVILTTGSPLKAMILADTHLLGSRQGHWFDKLRREWQMERSFQTALALFNPEAIFVLGDLFDEGKWCSDTEFKYYVTRFSKMLRRGSHNDMHILVGNHDVGFHSMIDDHKLQRFFSAYSTESVKMIRLKDNIFVALNSMAFEGDNCDMCQEAEDRLRDIATSLNCAKHRSEGPPCNVDDSFPYTRPIILQHFPMYRKSDSNCTGIDAAPADKRNVPFMPKWDCLSKDASQKILDLIKPRLIFGGHTHNFCYMEYADHTREWTLSSFSWRYKSTPSFLLATIGNNNESVRKCYLPNESTVIYTYVIGLLLVAAWIIVPKKFFAYRPPLVEKTR